MLGLNAIKIVPSTEGNMTRHHHHHSFVDATAEGVLRNPHVSSTALSLNRTTLTTNEDEEDAGSTTKTLEDESLTGLAQLRFPLPDDDPPLPPPSGGPPPPQQRRFSTYEAAMEAAATKAAAAAAAEAAAIAEEEAAVAEAAAEAYEETLKEAVVSASSIKLKGGKSTATVAGETTTGNCSSTRIPQSPSRLPPFYGTQPPYYGPLPDPPPPPPTRRFFGPIVCEFGFLWRSFVVLEDGFVCAGLEKLGPDPHLEFGDAKRLAPETDPFVWSLNHEEKHKIIRSINQRILQSRAAKNAVVKSANGLATAANAAKIDAASAPTTDSNAASPATADADARGTANASVDDAAPVIAPPVTVVNFVVFTPAASGSDDSAASSDEFSLDPWNGAVVTSGGFIWKIEFYPGRNKSGTGAASDATDAAAAAAAAASAVKANASSIAVGVYLTKLGIDPKPNCECPRRLKKLSRDEAGSKCDGVNGDGGGGGGGIGGGGGGCTGGKERGTYGISFESKRFVGFDMAASKSPDGTSLHASHREKSRKVGSIFVAHKQEVKPFACCYCEDKVEEDAVNPLVQINISLGSHERGDTGVPAGSRPGSPPGSVNDLFVGKTNSPYGSSKTNSPFGSKLNSLSGSYCGSVTHGDMDAEAGASKGNGTNEKPERDFLQEPLTDLDVNIYLKRYPPKGYKDPEPILFLVKSIKGVKFPTIVRRSPKEGVAVYDLKRKRISNDGPKVIWVRRPSPRMTAEDETRKMHSSVQIAESRLNANNNDDNDDDEDNGGDDEGDDGHVDGGRGSPPYRAAVNAWGVKRICKIDCLRNPEKGYRDEEQRVEIILKFGPAKDDSGNSEKKEIVFLPDQQMKDSDAKEPLEKWWWWRRETAMLRESMEEEDRQRKREEKRLEKEKREKEAENQLRELISVRSRDRAPSTERVLLADDRLVRPWWKKKEVTPSEIETQDGDQPKRRRWAPGMKFDEQGHLVATLPPADSEERRRSSDWNAPKGLWRRRLETRPAERRRFSPSGFHDFGAFGKQESQILKNVGVASGFLKPRERALDESKAFD